ncbi:MULTISPECIES: hypothetical protein [Burkholderia]|uniref:hypothetical protein n=1 Tax=Burkholderia TaxID=32008 RepID=UPI000A5E6CD0|nr:MULTISPECIES: hypothetical protein [Burkholderia]
MRRSRVLHGDVDVHRPVARRGRLIVGDVQRFPVSTERDKNVMRARRRAIELLGANEWKFVGEADIGTQRRTDIDHP